MAEKPKPRICYFALAATIVSSYRSHIEAMNSCNEAGRTDITFIIPVRHQDNAKDWSKLKRNLAHTMKSIAGQEVDNWCAIVVANMGADLPPMPPRFSVEWVDFPPNALHDQGNQNIETFRDAFRIDKGRRVLAGMLRAKNSFYYMIVDDDDFISRKVSRFVLENMGQNGWFIKQGYVWQAGSRLIYLHTDFSHYCGTSLIVRRDLYELPASLDKYSDENIKNMLGSHIFIADYLQTKGVPLSALPFPGAVYQIGHSGAHSRSAGLLRTFLFNKANVKSPVAAVISLMRIRRVDAAKFKEFSLPARQRF